MNMKLIGLSAALALLDSTNRLGRAIIRAQRGVRRPPYGENTGQSEELQLHDARSSVHAHDLPALMPRGRVPVAAALCHPERKRHLTCIWRSS